MNDCDGSGSLLAPLELNRFIIFMMVISCFWTFKKKKISPPPSPTEDDGPSHSLSLTTFFLPFSLPFLLPPFPLSASRIPSTPRRGRRGSGAAGERHELLHGERVLYTGRHGAAPEQRPRGGASPAPPAAAAAPPGTRPGPPPSHPASAPFPALQGQAAAVSADAHPRRQVDARNPPSQFFFRFFFFYFRCFECNFVFAARMLPSVAFTRQHLRTGRRLHAMIAGNLAGKCKQTLFRTHIDHKCGINQLPKMFILFCF